MFGPGLLNLGSLVLGLVALVLPIASLMLQVRASATVRLLLAVASIGACAISICLQTFYTAHLVKIEDWSALLDTADAVAWISAALLACTLALNAVSLAMQRRAA